MARTVLTTGGDGQVSRDIRALLVAKGPSEGLHLGLTSLSVAFAGHGVPAGRTTTTLCAEQDLPAIKLRKAFALTSIGSTGVIARSEGPFARCEGRGSERKMADALGVHANTPGLGELSGLAA